MLHKKTPAGIKSRSIIQAILPLAVSLPLTVLASEIHVRPEGPVRTLQEAQVEARKTKGTVIVHEGTYYLPETIVFTSEDSGTEYRAAEGEKVVISGGQKLDLKWEPLKDGIMQAKTPPGLQFDQLFVNGRRQDMARGPKWAKSFSKERAARWSDPAGGFIHAIHKHQWGGYHYRITGKNADGEVTYEGGWQNNRQMGMDPESPYVENIFEELDAPGEWFHNTKTNTLYYYPAEGVDLKTAGIEVVRLRHLIEFRGTLEKPVRNITLRGFIFRHAERTFMETKEPLLRSDWTVYRGGAMVFDGAEDCTVADCDFDQLGGNAIFVNNYNRRITIRGCDIHDIGASAIAFVGDTKAVRNPLFEYNQRQAYNQIDKTPGPQTENYPADCLVEDCLIRKFGVVEKQATGIQLSMAMGITVRHCSIYEASRAGININEGTFGGHVIEFCDVFDTVRETGDHGSFNSWGRDRFWQLDNAPKDELPDLALLDVVKPNIIRNSRWRCDRGWDVDLDDGSSNYEIYNNLFLRGGLKLREGFHRKVWNNIALNNTLHPHVWYENSGDEVTRNIWMDPYQPAVMKNPKWGKEVDRNLFTTTEADRTKYLANGCDANSLVGDPMFVDPSKGDFRVKEGSPALKLGFVNFPMDQFGVQSPRLKAIARTPEIPAIKTSAANASAPVAAATPVNSSKPVWLGATVKNMEGEEFSAFGVSKEDGGVQLLEVESNSPAANAGLQSGDLLQSLNGDKIKNVDDLFAALCRFGDAPLKAGIIRSQKPKTIDLSNTPYLLVETTDSPEDFEKISPDTNAATNTTVTAQRRTAHDPLEALTDGEVAATWGPVFANRIVGADYKLDLGSVRSIGAINIWAHARQSLRDQQHYTVFGSASEKDPGWNTNDTSLFIPLGTVDTRSMDPAKFRATSLRAHNGSALGKFRWIVWSLSPLNPAGEYTAVQELGVEEVKSSP